MPDARKRRTALALGWVLASLLATAQGAAQERPPAAETPTRWSALLPTAGESSQDQPGFQATQAAWVARIEARHADPAMGGEAVARIERLAELWQLGRQTLDRRDLARLTRVEQLLQSARQHAGRLEEDAALGLLVEAERTLGGLLHVPGTATLYAEVQTALGLVAAQAGLEGLAVSSLRRAAVVDPARGVRAAETTPVWVDRANQLSREVATSAQADVPITANVEGARVYLDDRLQGTTPLRLRATRGDHVLRVEADGHRALGTWLMADAGTRPGIHAELSRDPLMEALSELEAGAHANHRARTRAALQALQAMTLPLEAAWLLQAAGERADRALVTRCTADACEPARRLELDLDGNPLGYGIALDPVGLGRDRDRRDRQWLNAAVPTTEPAEAPASWWTYGMVWGVTAVLVGGAIAAGAALNQGPDSRGLRVRVEP